jgi:hypothetical protein
MCDVVFARIPLRNSGHRGINWRDRHDRAEPYARPGGTLNLATPVFHKNEHHWKIRSQITFSSGHKINE